MKKIFSFITALIAAVATLTGCASSVPAPTIDSPMPWDAAISLGTERCEYKLTKTNEQTGEIIAEGSLVYELGKADGGMLTLTADSTMSYNDSAAEIDRGKTDEVHSSVTFDGVSLMPARSHKEVVRAPREGRTDVNYTLDNDYSARTSHMQSQFMSESVISFESANTVSVFDNEMLPYALRAFKALAPGASGSFNVAEFFDMHNTGSFSTSPMRYSCAESTETMYFPGLSAYLDEQGSASAIIATVSLNRTQSGPPIEFRFSDTSFRLPGENTGSARKVLLSAKTYEYDLMTSTLLYTTLYTLTAYSAE